MGIGSYLFLSVSMWSCVYVKIDGYLDGEFPFIERVSTDVSYQTVINFSVTRLFFDFSHRQNCRYPTQLHTSQVGLFSYQEFAEYGSGGTTGNFACVSYTSGQKKDFFDGAIKAARGFAILANISIGAGVLALLIASCAYFEIVLLRGCGWLFISGSVFAMWTLVFLASTALGDDPLNASMWWGGGLAILASLTALATGLLTIRLPESEYEPDAEEARPAMQGDTKVKAKDVEEPEEVEKARPMRPGTETTTETILDDGRRKYTTTKWNKNGTKTITETFA